jgi:Asp/Glu/hydantoin racemase
MPRIALIHALVHSPAPVEAAFQRLWPEAERFNLLDDSLSRDLAAGAPLDEAMTARFLALADHAVASGAGALLFTCSAFGPCIEAVVRRHAGMPVLKPNEAMIDDALRLAAERGGAIGLLASFEPTLRSMRAEFPPGATVHTALAEGALAALDGGDVAAHDAAAVEAARSLAARGCGLIALAQFSLARAAPAVAAATGLPVLTTPDSAVRRLRARWSALPPGGGAGLSGASSTRPPPRGSSGHSPLDMK